MVKFPIVDDYSDIGSVPAPRPAMHFAGSFGEDYIREVPTKQSDFTRGSWESSINFHHQKRVMHPEPNIITGGFHRHGGIQNGWFLWTGKSTIVQKIDDDVRGYPVMTKRKPPYISGVMENGLDPWPKWCDDDCTWGIPQVKSNRLTIPFTWNVPLVNVLWPPTSLKYIYIYTYTYIYIFASLNRGW